jgi:hypothetical protein
LCRFNNGIKVVSPTTSGKFVVNAVKVIGWVAVGMIPGEDVAFGAVVGTGMSSVRS